jgi:primosomal protein N'
VVIQTRRPERDWQKGLNRGQEGWRVFWRDELKERREFSMPPFTPLIKIEANARQSAAISARLASASYEYWSSEETNPVVWIRTKKLPELRRLLSPFFHIRFAREGFPKITVWHE